MCVVGNRRGEGAWAAAGCCIHSAATAAKIQKVGFICKCLRISMPFESRGRVDLGAGPATRAGDATVSKLLVEVAEDEEFLKIEDEGGSVGVAGPRWSPAAALLTSRNCPGA